VYATIQEEIERSGGLSLAALCASTGASRAGFYRFQQRDDSDPHMELRDRIQRIALDWPAYGYRRVTAELRRHGWEVNHKLVLRLMREDNLLCVRRRKFLHTTDSDHDRRVYPNLAESMTLSGVDQLWIADITYIRLLEAFVYLAVILDAYSRRILGWALEQTLEDELTLGALRMALDQRRPAPGAIHHSDRGAQYASRDYVRLLKEHGFEISMSRKASPWENAACESFMKTLKHEEVCRQEYRNLAEAQRSIQRFLEQVYNEKRLHSALGYRPPAEFEASLLSAAGSLAEGSNASVSA
jgi:transposase InsO family protein